MKRSLFITGILIASFLFGHKTLDCTKIKKGTFYFYPEPNKEIKIIRSGSIQKEIFAQSKDTSFWKIAWLTGCRFNLGFIRTTRTMTPKQKQFYESHVIKVQVLEVAKDYYSFKAGLDSITSKTLIDTIWFKKKI